MNTLDDLIVTSAKLDETASKIQTGEEVGLSADQISELIENYDDWYTDCLAILPDDLQEKFQAEYEGKWHSYKIKRLV